jgi:hypothetical protein
MHQIRVYFIPELAPIAQVIAMPTHHRKRKYARAAQSADVIELPRLRGGSYPAAKRAVAARCQHLHLAKWQTDECLGRVASEIRKGRSTANAVQAGIALAKLHARDNVRWNGGGAA